MNDICVQWRIHCQQVDVDILETVRIVQAVLLLEVSIVLLSLRDL